MDFELNTLVADIPNAVYHADREFVSSSGLKQLLKSPAHFMAWLQEQRKPTDSMIFGTAVHTKVLEPHLFEDQVMVMPKINKRTKAGKEEYSNFMEKAGDKLLITQDQHDAACAIATALRTNHPMLNEMLSDGTAEKSGFCELGGVKVKVRPDFLTNDDIYVELKTTSKLATPQSFSKACIDFGYDLSVALYLEALEEITGKHHSVLFAVCETSPPYATAIFEPDWEFLEVGREKVYRTLEILKKCRETEIWPGYSKDIQKLSLPKWSVKS